MVSMPGLDTSEVGIVAFWNAIFQGGVSSIDPKEQAVKDWFDTYNEYDNGLEGIKTQGYANLEGVDFNVRIKDDGWIVAWTDRTNNYYKKIRSRDQETFMKGYYDILRDWTDYKSNINPDQHVLAYLINSLASQLSNWGDMTWDWADVMIYCYEYPEATSMTQVSLQVQKGEKSGSVAYTSGTTRYYHAAVGSTRGEDPYPGVSSFAGIELTRVTDDIPMCGAMDVIAEEAMPNPNTSYTALVSAEYYDTSYSAQAHLMLWK